MVKNIKEPNYPKVDMSGRNTANSMRRYLLVFSLVVLIFATTLPVIGFFLSWGKLLSEGVLVPDQPGEKRPGIGTLRFLSKKAESLSIRRVENHYEVEVSPYEKEKIEFSLSRFGWAEIWIQISGRDAVPVGYMLLVLGIAAFGLGICSLISRLSRVFIKLSLAASIFGLLSLLVIRGDQSVVRVWGSLDYALRHLDFTLGYPIGPGLSFIGFLVVIFSGIAFLILEKKSKTRNIWTLGASAIS